MESLEAKKVRLLSRFLTMNLYLTEWKGICRANQIISLLNEVEEAYWLTREEADFQTHCSEVYGD